jgi:hypothetical protein
MENSRHENVHPSTRYEFECWGHYHVDGSKCQAPWDCPEGVAFDAHDHQLQWADGFNNIVVTAGLNKLIDATFKTGLASPAWFVGLVDNASFSAYAAADTMASHSGWIEGVPYSNGTRPSFTAGSVAAGSVDNSASKAVFTINATLTVRGAFLVDNSTKSGTTGTLYGEGDFASSRSVISGDTLNVQVTLSAS